MNLNLIILFFILLFIFLIFAYWEYKNRELLKSVTSLNRGTKSEHKMILKILKSGIKSTSIFHDLYLNIGKEKYSQIDLVVATKVGIVVFEIKEYNGWIFGTENQLNWTQILAYGKRKYKFYNPIMQNKKHVEDLKKHNCFDNIPVFSMIVFFGACEFKNLIDLPSQTFLTKSNQAMNKFNEILEKNQPVNYGNVWEIGHLLKYAVQNGENQTIREKHITNIQKLIKTKTIY